MGKYDDIINMPHHVSDFHTPMPMRNRAAQFAPFAALTGHDDAIEEAIRQTENFLELSDEEKQNISHKLNYAIEKKIFVKINYFVPDSRKKGGHYKSLVGKIKKLDEFEYKIEMEDGIKLPVKFISEIYLKK